MKQNFIIGIILIVFISSVLYFLSKNITFITIVKNYIPQSIFSVGRVVFKNELNTKRLNNDYNKKFLPQSQFLDLKVKKIDLGKFIEKTDSGYAKSLIQKDRYPFFLEKNHDKIFFVDTKNNFYFINQKNILSKITPNKIKSNLTSYKILDIKIDENVLYVSTVRKKNNCLHLSVSKSELNIEYLNFSEIFFSNKCMNFIQSGKIEIHKIENQKNLLLTTAGDIKKYRGQIDPNPQSLSSIYGKIISINLKNNKYEFFSIGHRNILGLYTEGDLILSTENGPKGGDEINKIEKGKNYGWNVASYGETYSKLADETKSDYFKSHKKYGFKEPIFSFIPSIGISEIIRLGNNFSTHWQNNFLIASLNSRHIYRVLFNESFEKVIYIEDIFIGERIRDLLYLEKNRMILLAMEETGSLLILGN
tara:strand:- start:17824 stop:19083 length:1260 start_codon:yes stop_codon:yes gene_type:complete